MPALAFNFLCSVFKEHRFGAHAASKGWRCKPDWFRRSQPVGREPAEVAPGDPVGPFGAASHSTCYPIPCQAGGL
jgi:hypothetical protein